MKKATAFRKAWLTYILASIVFLFCFNQNVFAEGTLRGTFIPPCEGSPPITSDFGWRTHPIYGTQKFHAGLDIGVEYGTPVYAAQSGVVIIAGWVSGYGNSVYINHGGGVVSIYGHNESVAVFEGQQVNQGQLIAYAGSTGNSTGPHVHFQINENGEPVSPYLYCIPGSIAGGADSSMYGSLSGFAKFAWDASLDFAKPAREISDKLAEACTEGLKLLESALYAIFMILITIDLVYGTLIKTIDS